jgi:hypothetical protein
MEPWRLRCWRLPAVSRNAVFYTCARPGRSKGKTGKVPDALLHQWVRGLPGENGLTVISLLGQKPDGTSEWSFYSFFEKGQSLQDWLARHYPAKTIQVVEYPTIDFQRVPDATRDAVLTEITACLLAGRIVVVVDSGGEQRSGQLCTSIGAYEASGSSSAVTLR